MTRLTLFECSQVSANLRVYSEDGRAFIRSSIKRAFEQPFPPSSEKKPSKRRQQRDERRSRQDKMRDRDSKEESPNASERSDRNRIGHFVMNLPDSAIEFLDAYRGLFKAEDQGLIKVYDTMPLVHCYCFTRFLEPREAERDIRKVRARLVLAFA